MNKGFFIVQREMIDRAYSRSSKIGVLMLVLHRLASFGERTVWHRGNPVDIKPGELVAGLEYLSEQTCLSVSQVRTALKIAEESQMISTRIASDGRIVSIRNWSEMQKSCDYESTDQSQADRSEIAISETKKNKENIYIGHFDFRAIYNLYPRKIKFSVGEKKLKSSVKSESDYEDLKKAVHNYSSLCSREAKEKQYIMHWSTFCGCWRDFVNDESASPTSDLPRFKI